MGILLEDKALEPTLPDMTAGLIMPVVASYMTGHQPLHEATQFHAFLRVQQ
jgi:hypothetical protein